MPTTRVMYRYHFKLGNKIVHRGITHDLPRREWEHRNEKGRSKGRIHQVGFRTTFEIAREWELEQAKKHPDQVREQ